MPTHSFASFEKELNRLVGIFEKNFAHYKKAGYDEASLRQEFLNPLFAALGWDVENKAGHIPQKREVEVESRTQIGGRAKRADYLFRTDGRDRFVCEAKKPADDLGDRPAFQAKRYAWNKDLPLALLTDFEEMKIFIVGGRPYLDEPEVGRWETWHYKQYPLVAQELWNLLARENVAAASIDTLIESLPKKKPTSKGKAKQQWLIRPDRSRALDHDFLEFLDDARRDLASDLYKHNDHATLLEGNLLNESVQCILDRILFLRICEDRDIDTGESLESIVDKWRKNYGHDEGRKFRQESMRLREDSTFDLDDDARSGGGGTGGSRIAAPRESLWYAIVRHFRALDRRPASHVPYFNGNIFKLHGCEKLLVGDEWLAGFIGELSNDETPYLFNVIPVEILGSVYERFLGKVVVRRGTGIAVDEKPEVRKAGGVYYTPRYIVDYIVEQTVGRQLDAIAGGENDASAAGRRASGSAGAPPAVPGAPAGNTGDASGEIAGRPDAARTTGMSSARARTTAGGAPALPVSNVLPRMVRLAEFEKATAALRILDPACGSGSFLIRAFERVCEHWQEWLTKNPDKRKKKWCWVDKESGDLHLTVDLKRRILTENIYGVDLDSAAVEVTQLSLYLKMLENENRTTLQRERELFADEVALLPPLQDNIKCGNSLIASDFSMMSEDLVRVNAFDWDVQFRDIMKAGGFDAVIGNPPWGALFSESELEYLRERHREIIVRMIDSFIYFTHAAVEQLRDGGSFGMILPDVMLYQTDTEKLRQFLTEKTRLTRVCNMGNVFDQVTRPACIVVSFKGSVRDNKVLVGDFVAFQKEDKPKRLAEAGGFAELEQARILRVPGCQFTTSGLANFSLWERVSSCASKKLADLVDDDGIQRGVSPDLKEAFLVDSETAKRWKLEKEKLRPVLTGGKQVKRYDIHRPDLLLIYTRREDDFRKLPRICEYIDQFKKQITCKEVQQKKHSIYSLHRARDEGIFLKQPKLVGVITEDEIKLALDDQKTFATDGLYLFGVKPAIDIRYIMAVMNSRLFVAIYRLLSMEEGRALAQVKPTVLANLPIRTIDFSKPADKARHDKLVMLVEKMLALTPKLRAAKTDSEKATLQNAVTATDRQIDQLVYELYGLTPEEIALVEKQEG